MSDKTYTNGTRRTTFALAGLALLLLALMILGAGCSGNEKNEPVTTGSKTESQTANEHDAPVSAQPEWVGRMGSWPDTLRLTFDSTSEVMQDDLMLRLRSAAALDVSGTAFQDEKPLRCETIMTVRPIPAWSMAQGLVLDSVVFYDPVKNRTLPSIPMLGFQRDYSERTVRTQFLANMGDPYRQSPDLVEGQELVPTIYLSWDGRIIIASMPPITLAYLKE